MSASALIICLSVFAAGFAIVGVAYARADRGSLEDYVVARNTQSGFATMVTLLATSLGAWILFAPPQAATWGGVAAVTGYALGALSPRLLMIPLGQRMRTLMPRGHTLSEFVMARYGRPMYVLTLAIMLFYLAIALTAEITAISKLVTLIGPVPLWVTAAIVMGATLIYTSYGGLKATIVTDKVQMVLICPLLLVLIVVGWHAAGGAQAIIAGLETRAPELLSFNHPAGLKAGATFFVAILLTGLFHQGNWQRVYSARDIPTMRRGFLAGGLLAAPMIFIMGMFGLAFVGLGYEGDGSVALFSVVMPQLPVWAALSLIPLGLALVMSTADTAMSAVSSLVAVDARRLFPEKSTAELKALSRRSVYVLAVPVVLAAAQGFSVLYLFLLADLLCAAAAFPVFLGMFSRRHDGRTAVLATLAGLAAGLACFPLPGEPLTYLLESFLLAAFVPVIVTALIRWYRRHLPSIAYDYAQLQQRIRTLDD